eukprot:gene24464-10064_t
MPTWWWKAEPAGVAGGGQVWPGLGWTRGRRIPSGTVYDARALRNSSTFSWLSNAAVSMEPPGDKESAAPEIQENVEEFYELERRCIFLGTISDKETADAESQENVEELYGLERRAQCQNESGALPMQPSLARPAHPGPHQKTTRPLQTSPFTPTVRRAL